MSATPKRGIKRKRGPEEPTKATTHQFKKPPIAPEVKFRTKLHHGIKEVKKAAKTAKTRELQRLVKRLKELRAKEDQKPISEIEDQLEALKSIDHENIALEMLSKRLNKDKHIQSNDQVKVIISQELKLAPGTDVPTLGVLESRISSSKALATPLGELVASLRALILPRKSDAPNEDKKTDHMEVEIKDEHDEGWESGSISGDDLVPEKDTMVIKDDLSSAEITSDGDEESGEIESPPAVVGQVPSRKATKGNAPTSGQEESTFLPSLAVGYTRGDSSASDWSGDEGENDTKVDPNPRKNRRGQRARKAIWEKKYGRNANHVKKQREEEEEERKKRLERRSARMGRRNTSGRTGPNQAELDNRTKDSGWDRSKAGAKVQAPLHPSWDAAKKRKAMPMIVRSEGAKRKQSVDNLAPTKMEPIDLSSIDVSSEPKQLATFERYDEFIRHLDVLLAGDLFSDGDLTEAELAAIRRLPLICDEYQEQSFLFDPWLDKILVPPVEALRNHVARVVAEKPKELVTWRFYWLAHVIYQIVKTRGYKIIVPFFPHEISDLDVVLTFMEQFETTQFNRVSSWAISYLMLLWLSLICRLPFDLKSFDDVDSTPGSTAQRIERIGKSHLDKAGLDRDSAALLLSRLYTRSDTQVLFGPFLVWCRPHLTESAEVFLGLGCLQTISEILKSGGKTQIGPHLIQILELAQRTAANTQLAANTTVRKQCIKITGRIGLALLPPTSRIRKPIRSLEGNTTSQNEGFADIEGDSSDVPGEVEGVIDDMLTALRDRDTTIRWSTAKYIARIASRVSEDFGDQLLDAVVDVYTLHYVEGEDLSATAEPSWHGVTLACAEFARQGLISTSKVPAVLNWVLKALFFDVRKGAHSVGSNVRDAACYFLWSLARAQDADTVRPHAQRLAQSLMTVALFDREVHIRRAASAAFQENVGRMGLFPHGIEVLKWTDFYGVGVRRNSFLVAAPQVSQFLVYRENLINYLVQTTLKHWDSSMREIGSQALGIICQPELGLLAPNVIAELKTSLAFVDDHEIHGAVLGLREMAEAFSQADQNSDSSEAKYSIFELIDNLREATLKGYRNDLLLEASCLLISSSISQKALECRSDIGVKPVPRWRFILDLSLRHRNETVQLAAARTIGDLSLLRSNLKTTNAAVQKGMTTVLGFVGSSKYPHGIRKAMDCLMDVVKRVPGKQSTYCIEARRNANISLARLIQTLRPVITEVLDKEYFQLVLKSFLSGLEDYTVDERGDVGSWVRISSIKGLCGISELIIRSDTHLLDDWLPQELYLSVWAGLLKQGAERLDNVRAEVGRQLVTLLEAAGSKANEIPGDSRWIPRGYELLKQLFVIQAEAGDGWNESAWLFPRIVQVLQVSEYRTSLLKGMVLSIGSRNESTHRPAATALTDYLLEREATFPEEAIIDSVFVELLDLARANSASNTVVLPILSTLDVLIEGGVMADASESQRRVEILISLVNFVGQRIDKLRNVQRISTSMRILVQLLAVPEAAAHARKFLPAFLGHAFPKVREETGEYLYLVIQAQDIPGSATAEPVLLQTNWSGDDYLSHVSEVVTALEN